MDRKKNVLAAVVMMATLLLSLTACGGDDDVFWTLPAIRANDGRTGCAARRAAALCLRERLDVCDGGQ